MPMTDCYSSSLVKHNLKVKGISICEEDDGELITIELYNAIIQSVYKPPNKQFILPPLQQQGNNPHAVIRDFNTAFHLRNKEAQISTRLQTQTLYYICPPPAHNRHLQASTSGNHLTFDTVSHDTPISKIAG